MSATTTVLGPGIHEDIPDADYFAHPALSQSQLKDILANPARYQYNITHPRPPRDEFDLGHVFHALTLGTPLEVAVIDAPDWRSKTARDERDAARAEGKVPLLGSDMAKVQAMRDAALAHPLAGAMLGAPGSPEVTAVWQGENDLMYRGRFDKLTAKADGTPVVVDLKSAATADPGEFTRSVTKFGYDLQDAHYRLGHAALTGEVPEFYFIAVEKVEPYFVGVHTLDEAFQDRGTRLRNEAIEKYLTCRESGIWPAYGDHVNVLTPPRWAA